MEGRAEGRAEGRTEGHAEGRLEGLAQGEDQGKIRTLWELVRDNYLSEDIAAARAGLTIEEFTAKAKRVLAESTVRYKES